MTIPHEETAFDLARRGLVWPNLDDAPGTIVEDATALRVGDIVATRGHARFRAAVITSVGRKNAKAVFTTPGAIAEAERIRVAIAEQWANLDAQLDSAGAQAGRNFDFYVGEIDPATRKYGVTDEGLAKYESFVADGRDAHVAAARTRRLAELTRLKAETELPLAERTLFTAATVKPGQAKILTFTDGIAPSMTEAEFAARIGL